MSHSHQNMPMNYITGLFLCSNCQYWWDGTWLNSFVSHSNQNSVCFMATVSCLSKTC